MKTAMMRETRKRRRRTAMPRTETPRKERRRTARPRNVALKTETVLRRLPMSRWGKKTSVDC